MGVLGKYGTAALKYWGSILASARQGLSTADMWTAIRSAQQQYGLATPGASAPDVMVLRGYANRLVNGAQALGAAAPSDSLTPDMMGVGPYTSSTVQGLAATPVYQVRFLNTVQLQDGTVTETWQTSVFSAQGMPGTVGELTDLISQNATELAAQGAESSATTPRGTSLGVSSLQITVV